MILCSLYIEVRKAISGKLMTNQPVYGVRGIANYHILRHFRARLFAKITQERSIVSEIAG